MTAIDMWFALVNVYRSIAVPSDSVPKLDFVMDGAWCADAGETAAKAAAQIRRRPSPMRARRRLRVLDMYCPPVDGPRRRSGRGELEARRLAERRPGVRVPPRIEHLVVRAAEAQPSVHAAPHARVGPEQPVWHLERRELVAVEDLALGDDESEPRSLQRDQRGQGAWPRSVLEEERRGIVQPADAERALDEAYGTVLAGQGPVALAHVAHEDRVPREVHGVHLGELGLAEQVLRGGHERRRDGVALGGERVAAGHQARGGRQRQAREAAVLGDGAEVRRVGAGAARGEGPP